MRPTFHAGHAALLLVLTSVYSLPARAQNAAQVRAMAATCANCHGTDGRSTGSVPGLAGLGKTYIVQQMAAFKAGTRSATIMQQLAKGFSDDEIELMATYFAQRPL